VWEAFLVSISLLRVVRAMKILMVDVVQRAYQFIQELSDEELGCKLLLRLAARDPVPQWQNPK
jgi:hypothetical protein